jgi:hypothetical protein
MIGVNDRFLPKADIQLGRTNLSSATLSDPPEFEPKAGTSRM